MEKLSKVVKRFVVMPAVMAGMAFLFSGCGTAAPRALTEEEIAVFNTEFFNGETSNMNNMLLAGEYNRPEEIDLFQLFYNGMRQGTSEISDEELALLAQRDSEAVYLDIIKVTTDEMDAFLQEHLGIGLEETQKTGLDSFFYLEEYDSYYLSHGDTNFTWCTVTSGTWETDDKLTLEYTKEYAEGQWVVTLQKKGDSYLFVSNLRTL